MKFFLRKLKFDLLIEDEDEDKTRSEKIRERRHCPIAITTNQF